jgi:hypothetical protein
MLRDEIVRWFIVTAVVTGCGGETSSTGTGSVTGSGGSGGGRSDASVLGGGGRGSGSGGSSRGGLGAGGKMGIGAGGIGIGGQSGTGGLRDGGCHLFVYMAPGCNGTVQPVCDDGLPPPPPCEVPVCACDGTLTLGCGYYEKPYRYTGLCRPSDAGTDGDATP